MITSLSSLFIALTPPSFSLVIYPVDGRPVSHVLTHEQHPISIDEMWSCRVSKVIERRSSDTDEVLYGRSIECSTSVGFAPKIHLGCTLGPDGLIREENARIGLPVGYKQILIRLTCSE